MHPKDFFKYCPRCGSSDFVDQLNQYQECQSCTFKSFYNPPGGVSALILNEKNQVLLTVRKHDPNAGMLDLPGGFMERGETAEEGLARELKEELGITLEPDLMKYFQSFAGHYVYQGLDVAPIDLCFLVTLLHDTQVHPQDDVEEVIWVDLENIEIEKVAFESAKSAIIRLQKTNLNNS